MCKFCEHKKDKVGLLIQTIDEGDQIGDDYLVGVVDVPTEWAFATHKMKGAHTIAYIDGGETLEVEDYNGDTTSLNINFCPVCGRDLSKKNTPENDRVGSCYTDEKSTNHALKILEEIQEM